MTPGHEPAETRFRLLEITRDYARHRLRQAGDEEVLRQRHADFVLSALEQAQSDAAGGESPALPERMDDIEFELRSALDWCLRGPSALSFAARLLQVARTLVSHWRRRGQITEGHAWMAELLNLTPERTAARAYALLRTSGLGCWHNGGIESREAAEEARSIYEDLGDRAGVARALITIGLALCSGSDAAGAAPIMEEALGTFRQLGDTEGETGALTNLGLAYFGMGDYARSLDSHERCLTLATEVGTKAWALDNIADVAFALGDFERADACYRRSLSLFEELRHVTGITECLRGLAQVLAADGKSGAARRSAVLFGAVDSLRADAGPVPAVFRGVHERGVEMAREALGDEAFKAAWQEGKAMPMEDAIAFGS